MENPAKPLPYGALAPDFRLPDATQTIISRHQFRGKHGLLILFTPQQADIGATLQAIQADAAEYLELNARVIIISQEAVLPPPDPVIFSLRDEVAIAWRAYGGAGPFGYAYFILDQYGGLEGQAILPTAQALPDAATLLGYIRGAQYKCNI
jgi:AhpC/TSA family